MKKRTKTNPVIYSSLVLALALTIGFPLKAQSAQPKQEKGMMGMGKQAPEMMERCRALKEQNQMMMEDLKAQDAQLTEQVATMNRAPADQKVDLMAGIVTLMAEQRITMNERKAKMEEEMMGHMMEHMQHSMQMNMDSMMQMDMDSMSQCPMMKGMMDDRASGAKKGQE